MNENFKYVLVIIMILAILYLLYKNSLESYSSCDTIMPTENNNSDTIVDPSVEKLSNPNKTLVVYHTTWCGYSRQFLQQMNQGFEKKLNDVGVNVKYVDCDQNKQECAKAGVSGYPTLILYTDKSQVRYNGNRSELDILQFVQK